MTPEALRADLGELGASLTLSVPLLFLAFAMDRGYLGRLRFVGRRGPVEPPLWGLAEAILCVSVWYIAQVTLSLIAISLQGSQALEDPVSLLLVQAGSAAVMLALISLIVTRALGQPRSALGLQRAAWSDLPPTIVLWGITFIPIGALLLAWNLLLFLALGVEPEPQKIVTSYEAAVREREMVSVILWITAGTVVAPLAEEVLFRGFIFRMLRERWGWFLAAGASSLLFAAVHFSLTVFLPLAVLGAILCYLVERTGSLYPAIIFHALFNGSTFAKVLLTEWR